MFRLKRQHCWQLHRCLKSSSVAANIGPRCCIYTDRKLDDDSISELYNFFVLQLTELGIYDSHNALRHAHDVAQSKHEMHVITTMQLKKHKVCLLVCSSKNKLQGWIIQRTAKSITRRGKGLEWIIGRLEDGSLHSHFNPSCNPTIVNSTPHSCHEYKRASCFPLPWPHSTASMDAMAHSPKYTWRSSQKQTGKETMDNYCQLAWLWDWHWKTAVSHMQHGTPQFASCVL